MQSYKHVSTLPDDSFASRMVSIDDCNCYKQIVGDTSGYTDINTYTYMTFVSLIVHHLRKANLILTGNYSIPSYEEYLEWEETEIYTLQCKYLEENKCFFVLNTCVFLVVDFIGKFRYINQNLPFERIKMSKWCAVYNTFPCFSGENYGKRLVISVLEKRFASAMI